ncbi:hypothetical protein A3J23_01145 [Candidatus Peregrinibacteria bacterium RIFCSPLOWO2_02_FULL_48_14]|nr:MAG: hypothetical protein A2974_00900 [Candidatus Peregrinibacteria bacterium RIFCSPLOWO2_01_FULL_48_20]OGJ45464.1 MAG: hypothetical protein A3J23_01145 [Candidatus Peregrinibacteria bacterium RIFCSPLOWO2_02_FULL_48_14]
MSLTLLALFMVPVLFKMVLDPGGMHRVLKEWEDSRAIQFGSALVPMLMAMLIWSTFGFTFAWKLEALLSWIALIIFVKGVSHLFPGIVHWKMSFINEQRIPVFGFLGLVVALILVYIDVQVL